MFIFILKIKILKAMEKWVFGLVNSMGKYNINYSVRN